MATYEVNVSIDAKKFPELGSPVYPHQENSKKFKDKKVKDLYSDSYQNSTYSLMHSLVDNDCNDICFSDTSISNSSDNTSIKLKYSDEESKTFRFMGMDIDEDFNAVIKLATGRIIVSPLYNKNMLMTSISEMCRKGNLIDSEGKHLDSDVVLKQLADLFSRLGEPFVRKVVTNMKEGSLYSFAKQIEEPDGEYKGYQSKFFSQVSKYISEEFGSLDTSNPNTLPFKSVIMNLVNGVEKEKLEATQDLGSNKDADLARFAFCALCYMFKNIGMYYCKVETEFGALDLWSNFNKKLIGDTEFNNRMKTSVTMKNMETGQNEDRIMSFSGVSIDTGIIGSSIDRKKNAESVSALARMLVAGEIDSNNPVLTDKLIDGNTDLSDIDDTYGMSLEEIQALSVLDSLRYIDEDAEVSRGSYDMNDPTQRGLFVKSAIRSYERNFKEFKPARNYDVTEALADMVERGDINSNPVKNNKDKWLYDEETSNVSNFRTSSDNELLSQTNTKDLMRVMKLVDKFLKQVLDSF